MGVLTAQETVDEARFFLKGARERQTPHGPGEFRQGLPSRHARHPIMIRREEFADRQPATDFLERMDADFLAGAGDAQRRVAHRSAG